MWVSRVVAAGVVVEAWLTKRGFTVEAASKGKHGKAELPVAST